MDTHLKLCTFEQTELSTEVIVLVNLSTTFLRAGERSASMPRILLAEDDDAVRDMLRAVLERDGFEVVAVANVREALSRIAAENFDVLLSDLHMPHAGDGFTVVSAMRHTHPKAVPWCSADTQSWTKPCRLSAYRLTKSW